MNLKYIYFTDVHIKGVNPGKRKDVYYVSILKKLMEIEQVIKRENAKFVVIGGDLFDLPKVSNQLLGEVSRIMRSWKVKVFVVPGNHDVYGQTISTLPHTSLGILEKTGVVTLMTRDVSPIYIGKANDPNYPLLAFTGQEYYSEIDSGVNNDYEIERSKADFNILIAHSMLLEKPFHPDIHHTLIKDLDTSADLIMTGHYHPDTFDHNIKNINSNTGYTRIAKPRSTGRLEATKHNIKHKPQYAVVEIDKTNNVITSDVKFYDFNWANEGVDVFDYEGQQEEKLYKSTLNEFKEKIRSVDLTHTADLPSMLRTIAQAEPEVSVEHIELALKYLVSAESNDVKKALDGYAALPYDIQIAKVVIINFQSHEFTEVEFTENSLNALIGESDNGKTAIIRAIEWVLYNEPKGNDYIRRGAKFAEVSIHMTNGNIITRRRTNSDSGHYEVYDATTKITERYTKFGNSIPLEVFNAHQMPKVQIGKEFESFNLAKQLDGPFMLSKSGAERATLIGKLTKTDVADMAIASISKEITNEQRAIKSLESEVDGIKKSLEKYNGLDKEKQMLDNVESIIGLYDSVTNRVSKLEEINNNLIAISESIANTTQIVDRLSQLESVGENISKIDEELKGLNSMILLYESLNKVDSDIQSTTDILNDNVDYETIAKLMVQTDIGINRLAQMEKCKESLDKVDTSLAKGDKYISNIRTYNDKGINDLSNMVRNLDNMIESLNAYNDYKGQLEKCDAAMLQEEKHIKSIDDLLVDLQREADELFKQQGTCPTCGHSIASDFHLKL